MRFDAPKVTFRRPAPEEGSPNRHLARADARRTAALAEAAAVLDVLPRPGESLHALMTGRYDLLDTAAAIIAQAGAVETLRLATLAYSRRNLTEMVRLLDTGAVRRLVLVCSAFFRDHNGDLWEQTLEELRPRGQRAAAARNHCKVITFAFAGGTRLALEGSANLRTNSNQEQFALFNDDGLHDFHAAWIDDMVSPHEGEQEDDPGAG
jgi:hypothetical protein